jgi:hypothetical protein
MSSFMQQFGIIGANLDQPLMECGVNSMMAVNLRSELSHCTGIPLPSTILLDYPSISSIQSYLRASTQTARATRAGAPPRDAIVVHENEKLLPLLPCIYLSSGMSHPLSSSQEQMFRIYVATPGTSAYNLPSLLAVKGAPSPRTWQSNWERVLMRHDVLRCRYSTAAQALPQ